MGCSDRLRQPAAMSSAGPVHPSAAERVEKLSANNHRRAAMKRIAMIIAAAFCIATVAGCNTMAGAGKDLERAGEKVQDAANKNK